MQDEISLGLPTTEFMVGLQDPARFYRNEVGFLTVIVKPLWDTLSLWLSPRIDVLLGNLSENLRRYQELLDEAS